MLVSKLQDIKSANIVYSHEKKQMFLIDVGLAQKFEESFTPDALLNKLAEASPRTEKSETIKTKIIGFRFPSSANSAKKNVKIIVVPTKAIKKPSSVFFGLMFDKNFLFPYTTSIKEDFNKITVLPLLNKAFDRTFNISFHFRTQRRFGYVLHIKVVNVNILIIIKHLLEN